MDTPYVTTGALSRLPLHQSQFQSRHITGAWRTRGVVGPRQLRVGVGVLERGIVEGRLLRAKVGQCEGRRCRGTGDLRIDIIGGADDWRILRLEWLVRMGGGKAWGGGAR